jgi:hypothetical protein
MKVPRVTDFDPNAKEPTLKSSLDNMPSIEKPQRQQSAQSPTENYPSDKDNSEKNIPQNQPIHQQGERPNARMVVHSNTKRIITRNSFEIYEDQMDSLRKIAFKEKMEGKIGSMSAMVREAIDQFLKKESSRE